ncbi:MAG: ferric reductase-like transmembrane domain-containing protein [Gemmataceae bacterium]|nr:ferric reductase-like transmembrane domain-containing protein [Gemmataceae bacterium]
MTVAHRRIVAVAGLAVLLVIPLAAFLFNVIGAARYLTPQSPPGQAAYIMMRPAGHVAFVLMFVQVVVGSNAGAVANWLAWPGLVRFHRALGVFTLGAMLAHPLLFGWGRTLRAGYEQVLVTFLPHLNENYWETSLAFGVFALYGVLLAIAAAVGAPRLGERAWRIVHALNYAAFFAAFYHCISIGSETRMLFVWIEYVALAIVAFGALAFRLGRFLPAAPRLAADRP